MDRRLLEYQVVSEQPDTPTNNEGKVPDFLSGSIRPPTMSGIVNIMACSMNINRERGSNECPYLVKAK